MGWDLRRSQEGLSVCWAGSGIDSLLRHHPYFHRDLPAHKGPAHGQCAG